MLVIHYPNQLSFGSTLSGNLSSLNVSYLSQLMNSSTEQNNNMNNHKDFDYKYEYELLQNSVQSNEFTSLAFSTPTSNISELNIWENKNGDQQQQQQTYQQHQQQQKQQQELPSEQLTQSNKTFNESLKIHCNSSTYLLYDKHLKKDDHLIQANILNMPMIYPYETSTKISSNDYSIHSNNFLSKKSLSKIKNYSLNITNKLLSPCKIKKINNNNNNNNHTLSTNQLYFNKSIKHSYTQNELSEAVKAICFGQLGTRKAANLYGIPRSTLRNKICKLNELKKLEEKRLGANRVASIFQVNCRRSYMYKRTLDHKSKNGIEKSVHTKKKLASIHKLRCSHQQTINQ
uniref:Mushroom body large-type Kenyon cell-specific protein 1 n=1 Tax=Schistosoma haematobium TaxID=6185 RepID=A0A094ZIR0_SCHHA